jgi:hypothetical protein
VDGDLRAPSSGAASEVRLADSSGLARGHARASPATLQLDRAALFPFGFGMENSAACADRENVVLYAG